MTFTKKPLTSNILFAKSYISYEIEDVQLMKSDLKSTDLEC